MLQNLIHRLRRSFYGWRMIAVSCAIRVLGGGLHAYGLSIFFLPMTQELELTRTSTSLVFSLARAQGAVEGPLAGYCIDRYGPRPVITIAVLLAGIGYLLLARVHSYAAHVGDRRRFFRTAQLRQDSRRHELPLHMGQRAWVRSSPAQSTTAPGVTPRCYGSCSVFAESPQ